MQENLPIIYLSVLLLLLGGTAIFLLQQVIKTRRVESKFSRLQKKLQNEKGTAQEYYELGSIYLDKKLFVQAVSLMQKALKTGEKLDAENKALIYNALGYASFAQEQYDTAIRNYKEALKLYPQYTIALNNLANVYERKQMTVKALETYEETLKVEPNNEVAKRRAESLRKRLVSST
ncbi:tetratricopeptide repeat protein [Candidatus Gracilibacteria bacterium]|jgi:tetratricopeptide (TPR) repeat protein|nr:tetratricopeptide repeat protein [Candidatus Gracilibacteria bacterium]NJM86668.1 tetratricopeptide repeat protein [Hydrococcus sp. RU_2_2]NJQ96789.1 tetratricopeptide repeat protein [Hydrococcus sp. CSU_1_8]